MASLFRVKDRRLRSVICRVGSVLQTWCRDATFFEYFGCPGSLFSSAGFLPVAEISRACVCLLLVVGSVVLVACLHVLVVVGSVWSCIWLMQKLVSGCAVVFFVVCRCRGPRKIVPAMLWFVMVVWAC